MRKHNKVPIQSIWLGLAIAALLLCGSFSFKRGENIELKRKELLEEMIAKNASKGSVSSPKQEDRIVEARDGRTQPSGLREETEGWTMTIQEYAKMHADGEGVSWRLVSEIIRCESNWDYNSHNNTSTAYGLAQFTDGTWAQAEKEMVAAGLRPSGKLDRDNPTDQIEAFIFYLIHHGESPWFASIDCWGK